MKHLARELAVAPGSRIRLEDFEPGNTHGVGKEAGVGQLAKNLEELSELQYRLYAEARRSLLVVLQGIDAGGKDGTIKHVMSGLNPQGVDVTSFKVPEGAEKRHDYLWRIHQAVPEWGKIGIFNRSHYEDVLVERVHALGRKGLWSSRYGQINDFEKMLSDSGVRIVKFLLYISKEEQCQSVRRRFERRVRGCAVATGRPAGGLQPAAGNQEVYAAPATVLTNRGGFVFIRVPFQLPATHRDRQPSTRTGLEAGKCSWPNRRSIHRRLQWRMASASRNRCCERARPAASPESRRAWSS